MRRAWARANLTPDEAEQACGEWWDRALKRQYPSRAVEDIWLVMGGRGSGKTRLGAEWTCGLVKAYAPFSDDTYHHIALVGETLGDVREVMIEGPSGILAVAGDDRPRFEPSRRRLVFDSGAVAQMFSSEDPESLRGPQFDAAWCDELAKWRHPQETFDMLQFGLRLGSRPRQLITTTPRPIPLIRRLVAEPGVTVTGMRTEDNGANLAAGFLAAVNARYAGSRLGRQELDGELIADREDALWQRAALERCVATPSASLERIVVAVDPPASSGPKSDACGIVAAARDENGRAVVLEDATLAAAAPGRWARAALALYNRHDADCIVAEVNQGGEMVKAVIALEDPRAPVKAVRARRGKWLRAEPVAALYEQGRVIHARHFPELEDEMCDFGRDGLSGGRSPDRVDALVWAITELMLGARGDPRIRDFE